MVTAFGQLTGKQLVRSAAVTLKRLYTPGQGSGIYSPGPLYRGHESTNAKSRDFKEGFRRNEFAQKVLKTQQKELHHIKLDKICPSQHLF